jgi:hypothetical protein
MSALADKVNEIMSAEWACVRALRRAEALSDGPGQLEVIKRVRKDCSYQCVNLANVVRGLQGRPTDIPSARFSMKIENETFADVVDLIRSVQQHIVDELAAVLDEPGLEAFRPQLVQIRQVHTEDIRWLRAALEPS